MKVAIVDYGMGNIRSIASALKYINVRDIIISSNEKELSKSDKLILPGVGSFRSAMKLIKDRGLDATLNELIIQQEKPVLGICLGMQLLGLSSNENGDNKGLGFVDATVDGFDKDKNLLIPHIG